MNEAKFLTIPERIRTTAREGTLLHAMRSERFRRRVRLGALILLAAALIGCSGASTDVPMFRGGPAHTGEHPGPGPEGAPALLWRFQTGGDVVSSPAVADGVVYFGSADGYLYAVEAESGRQRWRFQTDDGVSSSAAVVDGVVYFGSFDGAFYALDATSSGEEMPPRSLALPARAFTAALIVLAALSRLWAGVHWPSDTYGALLWAALALAVVMAFRPTIRALRGRASDVLRALRPG